MSLGLEFRLRQQMSIAPQVQRALRLLQLSSLEFSQEIEQALDSNPFLEENPRTPAAAPDASAKSTAISAAEENGRHEAVVDCAAPTRLSRWRSGANEDAGEATDWTEWTAAPVSLRDHLRSQLMDFRMSDRDRSLVSLVIDELTDAGYLETPLDELAALLAPDDDVDARELSAALKLVQQLDPPGIGARSLRECLELQLLNLPEERPGRSLALALVREHFELLARREFSQLRQRLGCDENALHGARALIRTLDPRPGQNFAPDNTRYVIPDVIVSLRHGHWTAMLNPAAQPHVRINRAYAALATTRNGDGAACAGLLQEARWLLRNVEQRSKTIQRVATAIVEHQRVFFRYGEAAMKPLTLREISAELGLHESTICRVTNGKYMSTPQGLYEFKYFFSRRLETEDGGSCSPTAVRALMKELLAAEDPRAPLSDPQLARMLAEQGIQLARRTITKYRTLMRVPSLELRRAAGQVDVAKLETGS